MEICTVGGYEEVGKNMTAVKIGEDVFLFDAGIYLPPVIELQEQETVQQAYNEKKLRKIKAIPNDLVLDKMGWRNKVRAIIIGHAHLDHVGGVPYIAHRYPKAPILATPFTMAVLDTILEDEKIKLNNRRKTIKSDSVYMIKGKNQTYKLEFIHTTHSTLQCVFLALHSREGTFFYALDFKLDSHPIIGNPPNYKKLRELGKKGIKVLVIDALYSGTDRRTSSERIARNLVEDALSSIRDRNSALFVTTFSSHIARLKSIVEFGKKTRRQIVFLGRSLNKYANSAIKVNQCPFKNQVKMIKYRKQIDSFLKQVEKNRGKYLVICTGHQAEPGSILDRIVRDQTPFKFRPGDNLIFSSSVIPVLVNINARELMDKRLRKKGVRIQTDIHVSVLPNTEVIINDSKGMKIKEIGMINEDEKGEIKVPAFDPLDFKIKWYNANFIEHDYNGKIFNIKTKSGRSVSITSGHSLFKLQKGNLVEEKGDNLKEGDYLAIPKNFSWYKEINEINIEEHLNLESRNYQKKNNVLLYNNQPICNLNIELTNEFAKLLGYYLAEGSAPRHISLVISKHEEEILRDIRNSITKCFPCNVNIVDKGTSYEIYFGARTLKKIFKSWFGDNAKSKKIPKFVFSANKDFKLNFLGAYINGDGCIDKGKRHFRIRIKTASKKLASDLLYLFSQVGICAKFDHVEINKEGHIAGNKKKTGETYAYVLRVQGKEYLSILKDFLSDKFKSQIDNKINKLGFSQQFPPESFPVEKLDLKDLEPKKGTYLYDITNYNMNCKKKKKHVSLNLIKKQSNVIRGFTNKVLNGGLLFDPIVKINVSNYQGPVYDFEVPGAQNFIGGFGGIMLHNSGHGGREDLRDLIEILKPEHIIPAHGSLRQETPLIELASELGYKFGKTSHLTSNGKVLKF